MINYRTVPSTDTHRRVTQSATEPVNPYAPLHAERYADMLGRLGVLRDDDTELAWLTGWGDKANAFLAPRIAAGVRLPVWTDPKTGATGWWKVDAVIDYVRTHPNIRRVCWIDDRLGDTGDEQIGAAKVGALLDRLGVEHLLVATDPAAGLTVGQLDAVEDWVAGREVTLPESTPFPKSEAGSVGEDGSAEDPTEEIPAVHGSSPPSPSGTVLISEVDGALRDLFGGDPDPGLLREITRAEMNGQLRFVWLTEWGESVNASLGRLLGGEPREVIPRQSGAGSAYGMWKLDAIESWMNANPNVKRIVWADPMLTQPAEMGFGTHADVAIRIARERGVELVVAALSAGSLTSDDVRKAAGAPIADTERVHSGR